MDRMKIVGLAFFAFAVMTPFSQGTQCGEYNCNNGGTCKNFHGQIYCVCTEDWTGKSCEKVKCGDVICYNGGWCRHYNTITEKPICVCPDGFRGKTCEDTTCDSDTCRNGGKCVKYANGDKECSCKIGFVGPHCEKKATQCEDANPCLNGGTCEYDGSTEGFRCRCAAHYIGKFCDGTDCFIRKKCMNGGTCEARKVNRPIYQFSGPLLPTYEYKCICPDSYYGGYCEHVDSCLSSPCLNGATCRLDKSKFSYDCQCPKGIKGTYCGIEEFFCQVDSPDCREGKECKKTFGDMGVCA